MLEIVKTKFILIKVFIQTVGVIDAEILYTNSYDIGLKLYFFFIISVFLNYKITSVSLNDPRGSEV